MIYLDTVTCLSDLLITFQPGLPWQSDWAFFTTAPTPPCVQVIRQRAALLNSWTSQVHNKIRSRRAFVSPLSLWMIQSKKTFNSQPAVQILTPGEVCWQDHSCDAVFRNHLLGPPSGSLSSHPAWVVSCSTFPRQRPGEGEVSTLNLLSKLGAIIAKMELLKSSEK